MTRRMILMLIIVAVVLGGIFGFKAFVGMKISQAIKAGGMPAQTISTTKAAFQDWQPTLQATGTLRAVNGADISSEVAGIVQSIDFSSGGDVEKGDVLIHLRADDDIAHLQALQATAKLAGITYDRDLKQIKSQAISQATVDADQAALENAKAQAAAQQAIVDKKVVAAPFAGHLGIRQVDVGQYLNPGTAIVTLQQLDPIYVDFTLPEQALTQLAVGQKVVARVDAYPGVDFAGEVTAINSRVDEATRNVSVRGTFKNPDRKLLPGMYATVVMDVGAVMKNITLPQTAITYNPYGDTVYLVDRSDADKPVAKQSFVKTGDTRGDQIAIISGVKEGDEIVTSGQIKLRNGMPVKVNNEIQPTDDANPKPKDH